MNIFQLAHERMFNITNHQANANQNHNETSPHTLKWLLSKRREITTIGEAAEKRELLYNVGGNANWCSHSGKQYRGPSNN